MQAQDCRTDHQVCIKEVEQLRGFADRFDRFEAGIRDLETDLIGLEASMRERETEHIELKASMREIEASMLERETEHIELKASMREIEASMRERETEHIGIKARLGDLETETIGLREAISTLQKHSMEAGIAELCRAALAGLKVMYGVADSNDDGKRELEGLWDRVQDSVPEAKTTVAELYELMSNSTTAACPSSITGVIKMFKKFAGSRAHTELEPALTAALALLRHLYSEASKSRDAKLLEALTDPERDETIAESLQDALDALGLPKP